MQKNTKTLLILFLGTIFAIVWHNLIVAFWGIEEWFFFFAALSFGLVFLIYLSYTFVCFLWRLFKKK